MSRLWDISVTAAPRCADRTATGFPRGTPLMAPPWGPVTDGRGALAACPGREWVLKGLPASGRQEAGGLSACMDISPRRRCPEPGRMLLPGRRSASPSKSTRSYVHRGCQEGRTVRGSQTVF